MRIYMLLSQWGRRWQMGVLILDWTNSITPTPRCKKRLCMSVEGFQDILSWVNTFYSESILCQLSNRSIALTVLGNV